jgi:hypothetical protein
VATIVKGLIGVPGRCPPQSLGVVSAHTEESTFSRLPAVAKPRGLIRPAPSVMRDAPRRATARAQTPAINDNHRRRSTVEQNPPITVPDDSSGLTEVAEPRVAERGEAAREATHMLRMALAVSGIFVRPWEEPGSAMRMRPAPPGGVVTVTHGQGADAERGFLAGLLASVADRSLPGTDPAEVARGYAIGVRTITGRSSLATGQDAWFSALQHRAAVSAALAQLPYPDGSATPNPESRLADELLAGAAQMAAQAATIRLLLHIPPDAFTADDVPAIERIRELLGTYAVESLAADATLAAITIRLLGEREGN